VYRYPRALRHKALVFIGCALFPVVGLAALFLNACFEHLSQSTESSLIYLNMVAGICSLWGLGYAMFSHVALAEVEEILWTYEIRAGALTAWDSLHICRWRRVPLSTCRSRLSPHLFDRKGQRTLTAVCLTCAGHQRVVFSGTFPGLPLIRALSRDKA